MHQCVIESGGWRNTIDQDPGSDGVIDGFRQERDRRGIGQMPNARRDAACRESGEALLEERDLPRIYRILRLVGAGQARIDTFQPHVAGEGDPVDQHRQVPGGDPKPGHPGVQFQLEAGGAAEPPAGCFDRFEQIRPVDGGRQSLVDRRTDLPRGERSDQQDRTGHTATAQLDPFFEKRHAEPIGPSALESEGDGGGSVSVGVRLDDGHDPRPGDALPDRSQVRDDPIHIHASPRGPEGNGILATPGH